MASLHTSLLSSSFLHGLKVNLLEHDLHQENLENEIKSCRSEQYVNKTVMKRERERRREREILSVSVFFNDLELNLIIII